MANKRLAPAGPLKGILTPPGDKSISHRVAILSVLAQNSSPVMFSNYAPGLDCQRTLQAIRALGVTATVRLKGANPYVKVTPPGLKSLKEPDRILACGNSGTTMRLLCGLLAPLPFYTVLAGDRSLNGRPMLRITEPLQEMGAEIYGRKGNRFAPLSIIGKQLIGIRYQTPVASAQVKSAILLAGLSARGETWVDEPSLSRDHTERMLSYFGVELLTSTSKKAAGIGVRGGSKLEPRSIEIPGDISSAAFFIAAALIVGGSELVLQGVGLNPTRTGFLDVIAQMGAAVETLSFDDQNEPRGDLRIKSQPLKSFSVAGTQVPGLIDEIPVLAVLATQAHGISSISDAQELRVKESDRLKAISENLKAMGASIEEKKDGLIIEGPTRLKGARLNSYGDHRIAMALSIAAMVARGESILQRAECASVSLPSFYEQLHGLQADRW